MEDGWKGEESGKADGEERGGDGESDGETRQSHEEHMRQLAGMDYHTPQMGQP